ncbi:MAG: YHS domain-containing (seleno)protein [Pseudomonadota bacterium]
MIRRTALAALLVARIALLPGAALAGEQYIDTTGFAVSGYDVVSYFALPQAPVGTPQPAPLPGKSSITAEYNGGRFAFATTANRDAFVANPSAFVPQYDGHCAYGVSKGGKVPGNPTLWRIVDGKLYLNITKNVVGFWEEDISGNLAKSEKNWAGLEPAIASGDIIPNFTSAAPVAD